MAETDRIVERRAISVDHQAHLAQLAQWIRDGDPATSPEAADVLDAAAEYIEKQTARIEEMEGALRHLVFKSLASEHGVKVAHKAMQDGAAIDDLPEMMDHRVFEAWSILTKDQGNG